MIKLLACFFLCFHLQCIAEWSIRVKCIEFDDSGVPDKIVCVIRGYSKQEWLPGVIVRAGDHIYHIGGNPKIVVNRADYYEIELTVEVAFLIHELGQYMPNDWQITVRPASLRGQTDTDYIPLYRVGTVHVGIDVKKNQNPKEPPTPTPEPTIQPSDRDANL